MMGIKTSSYGKLVNVFRANIYYPTSLEGCQVIVFTHGGWMGSQMGGRVGGGKKFVRAVTLI